MGFRCQICNISTKIYAYREASTEVGLELEETLVMLAGYNSDTDTGHTLERPIERLKHLTNTSKSS